MILVSCTLREKIVYQSTLKKKVFILKNERTNFREKIIHFISEDVFYFLKKEYFYPKKYDVLSYFFRFM